MDDIHKDAIKDSWKKYEACMRRIEEFLGSIQFQGQEVGLGNDIWLGSPAAPYVRTRLEHDPGRRIAEAIHRVEQLMSAVDDGFQGAIKDANRAIEEIKAIPVDGEYVGRLTQRTEWLQTTLEALMRIPDHVGQRFRSKLATDSGLMLATCSGRKLATFPMTPE